MRKKTYDVSFVRVETFLMLKTIEEPLKFEICLKEAFGTL
jgi:hypothetical protein